MIKITPGYCMAARYRGGVADLIVETHECTPWAAIMLGNRPHIDFMAVDDLFTIEDLQTTGMINEVA